MDAANNIAMKAYKQQSKISFAGAASYDFEPMFMLFVSCCVFDFGTCLYAVRSLFAKERNLIYESNRNCQKNR